MSLVHAGALQARVSRVKSRNAEKKVKAISSLPVFHSSGGGGGILSIPLNSSAPAAAPGQVEGSSVRPAASMIFKTFGKSKARADTTRHEKIFVQREMLDLKLSKVMSRNGSKHLGGKWGTFHLLYPDVTPKSNTGQNSR